MFSKTLELYDLIYRSFKDYAAEARAVANLLKRVAPQAEMVLDMACGTGEHARYLHRDHGYAVHGVDVEPGFVELARSKVPEVEFSQGDMTAFNLGAEFDVILCLFSSIGYLRELGRVEQALKRFYTHLKPGGVVVVEPWFTPESWQPGRLHLQSVEVGDRRIVRMSHSTLDGHVTKLRFHYLIGGSAGIEHRVEEHHLGLFTQEEMTEAFGKAGFEDLELDAEGLTGRGLYIARRNG